MFHPEATAVAPANSAILRREPNAIGEQIVFCDGASYQAYCKYVEGFEDRVEGHGVMLEHELKEDNTSHYVERYWCNVKKG